MKVWLPCVRTSGKKEPVSVELSDVCYITLYKKRILIYTTTDSYYFRLEGSLAACEIMFGPFGFEILDNSSLVNMDKIRWIDERLRLAVFENDVQTTISSPNMSKVKHIARKPT